MYYNIIASFGWGKKFTYTLLYNLLKPDGYVMHQRV
jgi:hypothetical protein